MKRIVGGNAAFGKRFGLKKLKDSKGNVALAVALSLPVLMLAIGGGADYARILAARSKLQAALDSATLATYMHYRKDVRQNEDDLLPYFDKTLKASLEQRFEKDIKVVSEELYIDREKESLRARVTADFPTTFWSLAGINPARISTLSEVKAGMNRTEVALVLDITKSMEGAKMDELKRAAKNFLDTINRKLSAADAESFKVAIVPFAEYVNVGMDKRNASWIQVDDDVIVNKDIQQCRYICDHPQTRQVCRWEGNPDIGMHEVCNETEQYCPKNDPNTREVCETVTDWHNVRWEGCVGSREYPYNMQDGNYTSKKVPGVMNLPRNPSYPADTYDGWQPWPDNHCPSAPITPLTPLKTNIDLLKSKIEALTAEGFTYIPIGLAWGWRVLSNNGPNDPFNEGADDATTRQQNVRKIIVLMTDGKNRIAPNAEERANTDNDFDSSQWSYRDHTWRCDADEASCPASSYADARLTELCNKIKEINPNTGRRHAEIITVTFDVTDDNIKNLLRDCATMGSFDAQSGELTSTFETIASSLSELHIAR